MDRYRFCVWILAGMVLVVSPSRVLAEAPPAATTQIDITAAVNMVGRQRMLSQRMVKAYLMLGQGIAVDDARSVLQESSDRFASHLATLKAFQPTPTVQRAIAELDAAWVSCKVVLLAAPNKAGAVDLYDASETLLKAAHHATLAYEDASGTPLDHLVNLAGRQRMLSQRMAKFYLYRTWELYSDPADMELHLSRAHFTAVLNQIESSPHASAQIKASVAQLRHEWEPYQQALFASREAPEMRRNASRVAELSEHVLARTEELVALIVAQADDAAH